MTKKLKILVSIFLLTLGLSLVACDSSLVKTTDNQKTSVTTVKQNSNDENKDSEETENQEQMQANNQVAPGYVRSEETSNFVEILMANGDQIVVELYPEIAPITVANFQKLVSEGFYNGLIFHRVIPGFMIQGGDPDGTGMGGAPDKIKGEFAQNGVENNLKHDRGVISMARSMNMDSASSQFFLMHANSPHLDGAYAGFGKIVYGLEGVDNIAELKTDQGDRPLNPPVMEEVFFVKPE